MNLTQSKRRAFPDSIQRLSRGFLRAGRDRFALPPSRRDIDYRQAYTLRFANKGVGLDLRPKK